MLYSSFRWLRKVLLSDWQHVGILIQNYKDSDRVPVPQYFHLFENQFEDRKYKLVRSAGNYWVPTKDNLHRSRNIVPVELLESGPVFQTKVYPWLHGAQVEEIPAYDASGKRWFVRKLQGKDPVVLNEDKKHDNQL